MIRNNMKFLRSLSLSILSGLLILVTIIATGTYVYRDISTQNVILHYTLQYQIIIMVILVVISVIFGFGWATISSKLIEKRKKESQSLLDLILLFLGKEDQSIINFLVEKGSETTQAEISRLDGMNRVKAHRSLQKLHEKNIIHLVAHGKVRKVQLKESIYNILKEDMQKKLQNKG